MRALNPEENKSFYFPSHNTENGAKSTVYISFELYIERYIYTQYTGFFLLNKRLKSVRVSRLTSAGGNTDG